MACFKYQLLIGLKYKGTIDLVLINPEVHSIFVAAGGKDLLRHDIINFTKETRIANLDRKL